VLKCAAMQARALLTSACQPGGDGARVRPKDAPSRFPIQAFTERGEHFFDAAGGSCEAGEWGSATGAEGGAAGLTAQGLHAFACAV
jgi:hypothetical protein